MMLDKSKVFWGCHVHTGGMNTRPSKAYYDPDAAALGQECWKTEEQPGFEDMAEVWYKLGMDKEGPSNKCVGFLSEKKEEVVIWMKGVAACMAVVHEWAALGSSMIEGADHFADDADDTDTGEEV